MRSTASSSSANVIVIDETLLARLAWIAVATAVISALFLASTYVLAATAVAVAAGIGVMSYRENEIRRDFESPLNEAWIGVVDALADNGLSFGAPVWHGVTEGRVRAGDARVVVELHPGGVSRVRVRVGTFALPDNRRRAALILEKVVQNLSKSPGASRA